MIDLQSVLKDFAQGKKIFLEQGYLVWQLFKKVGRLFVMSWIIFYGVWIVLSFHYESREIYVLERWCIATMDIWLGLENHTLNFIDEEGTSYKTMVGSLVKNPFVQESLTALKKHMWRGIIVGIAISLCVTFICVMAFVMLGQKQRQDQTGLKWPGLRVIMQFLSSHVINPWIKRSDQRVDQILPLQEKEITSSQQKSVFPTKSSPPTSVYEDITDI